MEISIRELKNQLSKYLRKVAAGEYDAAVLAVAGLERLGLLRQASQLFWLTPAP